VSQHAEIASVQFVERSKSMVKELYIKQITSTKTSTTLTKETVEKAETLLYQEYLSSRKQHEYTQTKTLKQLQQLIGIYHRQQKTDLITKELKSLILEAVINIRTTEEMVYVADFLASIFISYDLRRQALEIVRHLKLQAIYNSAPKTSAFSGATIGRSSFGFIAAFEYHIRSDNTLSIAHNIAELVAEHLFYGRFLRSIKAKAKLQQVFVHAARLRHILVRNNRFEDFAIIEGQLVDFFAAAELAVSKAVTRGALKAFVNVITKYAAGKFSSKADRVSFSVLNVATSSISTHANGHPQSIPTSTSNPLLLLLAMQRSTSFGSCLSKTRIKKRLILRLALSSS
jgi:hypothetical protein